MEAISTDKLIDLVQSYGLPLVWAIIVFIVGRIAARIITNIVVKMMQKSKVDETLVKFTKTVIYVALMVFVILAALGKLGIETTSFAAIIAAAGLAIGLSLQGTLGNFASGFMLILFRPFKVGDFVEAGGVSGIVEEIQIFSTKMRTGDNKEITVPNGQIVGTTITNYSAKETRRVDMVIGVSYNDDLKKVRAVLEDILSSDERILKDPAPTIGVSELADSSVNFVVRPWVKSADYWSVLFEIQEEIKIRFDAEGISIPYPQHDLHVVKDEVAA
ncbi:small conductance mechanosensitive channel [Desulfuromusa kysingii]|uniref:Small conductance mechanosensitive channel n=1 Tax=Desulfuromusa kysingii TaxID=37625 RepID=A0A1H4BEU1_9BACT|nr:mechanosensitive ion channel domain-containing protein [Desulfuromusa kysingii]SEA46616.1 small conductance mechanosensitive channel [Desulfuromusa kysingii]